MLKIHFSQNDMRNMMLIQQTLIQYLLQKKNLCEIFKVLTIWGNINLFIRPQHPPDETVNNILPLLKPLQQIRGLAGSDTSIQYIAVALIRTLYIL